MLQLKNAAKDPNADRSDDEQTQRDSKVKKRLLKEAADSKVKKRLLKEAAGQQS